MSKIILLADDSVDDELFFKHVIKSAGVENPIQVVRDGKQAIAYLQGEGVYADRQLFPEPTVLFLDLLMPGVDGWEVLKWLQTQSKKNLLVVVLAGSSQRRKLQEAYKMGADSFLFKPFDKAELNGLIQNWPDAWMLSSSYPPRAPGTSSPGLSAPPP
jgi:CheY-like chemotaxis protein